MADRGAWWAPGGRRRGEASALHTFNSVRVPFIRQALRASLKSSGQGDDDRPKHGTGAGGTLRGTRILDVGCGGGILSEALARLDADVTGLDASAANVATARKHAVLHPAVARNATYMCSSVEQLAEGDDAPLFDCVVASEVIEHVADPQLFVASCAALVKPGGAFVVTTINRTPHAYATAIVAAESLVGLVPAGTHDWSRFLTPEELGDAGREAELRVEDVAGAAYNPVANTWCRVDSTSVNYMMLFRRALR